MFTISIHCSLLQAIANTTGNSESIFLNSALQALLL